MSLSSPVSMRLSLLGALLPLLLAARGYALEITADTVWSGVVTVKEDTRVAPGATLTIEAGTRVLFNEAESTKTDPQFWNPDTELSVEGALVVKGAAGGEVFFGPNGGAWGGLVLAPGSKVTIEHAQVAGAQEAVLALGSELKLKNVTLKDSEYGLVMGPGAGGAFERVAIDHCEKAYSDLRGKATGLPGGVEVLRSLDADVLLKKWPSEPAPKRPPAKKPDAAREFVGEHTVNGTETWKGNVIIGSRVTVPPGSTLKIMPGTRVSFRKIDTNGDGLGEGELLVLGSIRCIGTVAEPVVFESAEENPAPGDWDKVSIISSEDPENRFEYSEFHHGVQALHSHFSSFSVANCFFSENLRALQFQESARAAVRDSHFKNNKQALRFRDSSVALYNCRLEGNDYGLHAFRCDLKIEKLTLSDTSLGGILAKESRLEILDSTFERNRSALRAKGEGSALTLKAGRFSGMVESGVSLEGVSARISESGFDGAGLDLVGLEGSEVVFRKNTFGASGRSAIHLKGPLGADARCNDWPGGQPAEKIWDGEDNPALGKITYKGPCE